MTRTDALVAAVTRAIKARQSFIDAETALTGVTISARVASLGRRSQVAVKFDLVDEEDFSRLNARQRAPSVVP